MTNTGNWSARAVRAAGRRQAIASSVGVASVVWLALAAGCVYSAKQTASGWLVVETGQIELRTNIRRDAAVQLANEMQRTYDILARYALPCARVGARNRVQVTVLPAWQFELYTPEGARGFYRTDRVTWLTGYEGHIVLPDDLGFASKQVFQHETIHRLVAACFVGVPAWLHEGLAAFFQTMVVSSDKVTFGNPAYLITSGPALRRPRSGVFRGQWISRVSINDLPSLEAMFALSEWRAHDAVETVARYATAWALVHLLVIGAPDLAPRFEAYLAELRVPGDDRRALFAKRFEGVPLQDRLLAYVRRGSFDLLASRSAVPESQAAASSRVRELDEAEGHLHLAWLGVAMKDDDGRERFRQHLAAAKQDPRTRDAAYLVGALAYLANRDRAGAEREVQAGLRGAHDNAALLEAHLDVLLGRKAPVAELQAAADRLRPLATTAGQLCSLAAAALRIGDRKAAIELSARAFQRDPRSVSCRVDEAPAAPPP